MEEELTDQMPNLSFAVITQLLSTNTAALAVIGQDSYQRSCNSIGDLTNQQDDPGQTAGDLKIVFIVLYHTEEIRAMNAT